MPGHLRNFRNQLHGAGGGTNHADSFPFERDRMIPARGVERGASEGIAAGNVGEFGPVQLAQRNNKRFSFELSAGFGPDMPPAAAFLPASGLGTIAGAQM